MTAAAFAVPSLLGSKTADDIKGTSPVPWVNIDETLLCKWASEHMARFQLPSIIEIVDKIKEPPTGKIEKRYLKAEGGKSFGTKSGI